MEDKKRGREDRAQRTYKNFACSQLDEPEPKRFF